MRPPRLSLCSAAILAALSGMTRSEDACGIDGLGEWDTWVGQVEAWNPGIRGLEQTGEVRDALLSAYPCQSNAEHCPPDRLVAFHCQGNGQVLLAYGRAGCILDAQEISLASFLAIVRGDVTCSADGLTAEGVPAPPLP
jgi:hypothetical protein